MAMSPLTLLVAIPLLQGLQSPLTTQMEELEHLYPSHSAQFATGQLTETRETERVAPWPVSVLSIGHTMASYQSYGFLSEAYFHHGLDIRANAGGKVIASRGGKVVNIENYVAGKPEYWEIAILDKDGFLWQYHHVDRDKIPSAIFQAYKNGTEITDGTEIGSVVYWPITSFGERYNHVHLNVLGKNKEYLNPFLFLEPLNDTSNPEIEEIGVFRKNGSSYSLYAHVKDLILSKVFTVPPRIIEMQIDGAAPQTVWKFDNLPGGDDENAFVNNFYIPAKACGNYSCRKPVIDLGFSKTPHQIFPTTPGNHQVTVRVEDNFGNQADKSFTWNVE